MPATSVRPEYQRFLRHTLPVVKMLLKNLLNYQMSKAEIIGFVRKTLGEVDDD